MQVSDLLWFATAAYAAHIMEEYYFNWRDWARAVLGLPVEWSDFYIANSVVIVLGIVAANLARNYPAISLGFVGLMVINALFLHILPMIRFKGRFSPGAITAVILFLPIGYLAYKTHHDAKTLGIAFGLGAAIMASPIVMLLARGRKYCRQS